MIIPVTIRVPVAVQRNGKMHDYSLEEKILLPMMDLSGRRLDVAIHITGPRHDDRPTLISKSYSYEPESGTFWLTYPAFSLPDSYKSTAYDGHGQIRLPHLLLANGIDYGMRGKEGFKEWLASQSIGLASQSIANQYRPITLESLQRSDETFFIDTIKRREIILEAKRKLDKYAIIGDRYIRRVKSLPKITVSVRDDKPDKVEIDVDTRHVPRHQMRTVHQFPCDAMVAAREFARTLDGDILESNFQIELVQPALFKNEKKVVSAL